MADGTKQPLQVYVANGRHFVAGPDGQMYELILPSGAKKTPKNKDRDGQGRGSAGTSDDESGQAGDNPIEQAAKARFAAEAPLRHMYGVMFDDPNSDQYKHGLARYVAAEKKYAADLKPERQRDITVNGA